MFAVLMTLTVLKLLKSRSVSDEHLSNIEDRSITLAVCDVVEMINVADVSTTNV